MASKLQTGAEPQVAAPAQPVQCVVILDGAGVGVSLSLGLTLIV